MSELRLIIRWILSPLWLAIFIVYLPIWYIQMSWYYFSFQDYWSAYLILWDRVMLFMKLKTKLRKNDGKDNLQVKHPQCQLDATGLKGNEQDFRNLKSFIDAEIRSLMEKGDIRRSFVETELRHDEGRTVIHIFRNHMIVQTYYIEA